jgi:hypothetical protein
MNFSLGSEFLFGSWIYMADGDGLLHACLVDVPNDHDVLIQSED